MQSTLFLLEKMYRAIPDSFFFFWQESKILNVNYLLNLINWGEGSEMDKSGVKPTYINVC